MKKRNRTTRFLIVSLILVSILTLFLFSFLAVYMNRQSTKTIGEVGQMYMSRTSEQISMHFETTISLRLDQLVALVNTVIPEHIHEDPKLQENLIYNAQARNFNYLAFYHSDGTFEMLYGSPLTVTDPEPFLASLSNEEKKVAIGSDLDGNSVVLLGVPTPQQAEEDQSCIALVAGLPVSYISDTLSLDENEDHTYSFIIREDGSYVIRTSDAFRENYFDRVRSLYEEVDGKDPELYITALRDAMANGEKYFAKFVIYGESRQLYCTKLPHSEWYLLTFMSYNDIDSLVSGFTTRWTYMACSAGVLVLVVLFLIFGKYLLMTRQQIVALEAARQAEENARQEAEQACRAKSEFLSNMSHDIRTPMNAVVGMTAIATANIDNKDQVKNCLKKIALSSKHLLGLINDVLDMSKIESGKMTLTMDQVSLREVMDSIVSIVQPQVKTKGQQFDVFIHDITVENICCDGVRLNQVLLNLLSNSVKFTPDGGSIYVSMYQEESPLGEDYIRTHFQVKDSGIGMSQEFQKKIFDSFVREDNARVHKTEGTGLGMTITKYIVDAMDGDIQVESELGKGTTFHVTLDMQKALVQETDMILPDWNMLVVDDDQQLCESTAESLKSIGVKAEWALNGESALELVKKRHQRNDDYQIILLDWKLPGLDGIQTAREIRKHLEDDIPILLISAYDWGEIEDAARDAGIVGFISKPLFKSTLFYGLRQFMGVIDDLPAESADSGLDLSGKRVLLAEDNELNWEIASELLSDLGLELDWAENGQICVDKFNQSEIGYYHVVLMDLRMPVMNGFEAAQAIRQSDRADADIPIIAMTADAFAEDVQKCLAAGMNAHIAKPIDVRDVSRLLEKYIKK